MEYSIQAIQQFQNTSGKNSSDSALIIDAMDLLHEGRYQCICLVSSDSDFTRLASRLRESEIYVVGMGEQKTPTSFRSACDKFLYLDVLMRDGMPESGVSKPIVQNTGSGSVDGKSTLRQDDIPAEAGSGLNLQLIIDAIDDIVSQDSDDEGWYFMGELGNRLASRFPDFDVRNFGFYKLTPFIESLKCYDVKSEKKSLQSIFKAGIHTKEKVIDEQPLQPAPSLPVMALLAQGLPVAFVPEEPLVASVRNDMVDHRRRRQYAALQTGGA